MTVTITRVTPATTPWGLVEQQLEAARKELAHARDKSQFVAVGERCVDALVVLLQAIYLQARKEGMKARLDDPPLRLLNEYISAKLSGPTKDAARSALALAHSYQESISNAQDALMCLEATKSVIAYMSISAGQGERESHETIADLVERLVKTEVLGTSQHYALLMLSKMEIGSKNASKLRPEDIIEHCKWRRKTVSGATVNQDIVHLKGLLAAARDKWNLPVSTDAIDDAKPALERLDLIGRATVRNRRPTRAELDSLVAYFDRQSEDPRTQIPMKDLVEFSLWTARRISEICRLRWEDLNEKTRTCVIRGVKDPGSKQGRDHEFPLLGKAWDIVQRQPRTSERIFPYYSKSASARYTRAKNALGIKNLRFQDLRREAAIRLHEAGHSVEQISRVTGRMDLNSLLRDVQQQTTETKVLQSPYATLSVTVPE